MPSMVHGLIVAQFILPYPFGDLQLHPVCPDCHRDWKAHGGRSRDNETYSLIHDEDDIESHAGTAAQVNAGEAVPRTQRQQNDA